MWPFRSWFRAYWPAGDSARDKSPYRSEELRRRIVDEVDWRDVPFEDNSTGERIDARTLTSLSTTCSQASWWLEEAFGH